MSGVTFSRRRAVGQSLRGCFKTPPESHLFPKYRRHLPVNESHPSCNPLSSLKLRRLGFFLWVEGLLFIVLMGAVSEVMNFVHHRTGLDMVKIPQQVLSQDRLDRSLRRQGPATGAKVGGKRVPNRAMTFQRYELEHAYRQAAKHDE